MRLGPSGDKVGAPGGKKKGPRTKKGRVGEQARSNSTKKCNRRGQRVAPWEQGWGRVKGNPNRGAHIKPHTEKKRPAKPAVPSEKDAGVFPAEDETGGRKNQKIHQTGPSHHAELSAPDVTHEKR